MGVHPDEEPDHETDEWAGEKGFRPGRRRPLRRCRTVKPKRRHSPAPAAAASRGDSEPTVRAVAEQADEVAQATIQLDADGAQMGARCSSGSSQAMSWGSVSRPAHGTGASADSQAGAAASISCWSWVRRRLMVAGRLPCSDAARSGPAPAQGGRSGGYTSPRCRRSGPASGSRPRNAECFGQVDRVAARQDQVG